MEEQIKKDEEKEEKINIESVLKDEKSEDNEQNSSFEFNNCIIYTGNGDINTVMNSGSVRGNIIQGTAGADKENSRQEAGSSFYNFNDKKEILKFVEDYRDKEEFLSFLSVAFLECVPDFLWIDINKKLFDCLFEEGAENRPVFGWEQGFMDLDKKLELLHMITVPAQCRTNLGKVEAKCMIYFSDKIRDQIEKTIWGQDYFLRKKILSWLISLKNDEKISTTMAYQVVTALCRISLYDWSIFQTEVFYPLLLKKGQQNRNYLVKILSYNLKKSSYKPLLDQQIQEWIWKKDVFLWEIAYRLYGINKAYKFNREIKEQMKQYLKEDLEWRCIGDGLFHPKWNPKVDIYPAYFNKEFEKLILQILLEFYKGCRTYNQKEQFQDYFIWLLTNDYKMEGYPCYQLIFLDVLNDKEIRLEVREMYWELWRNYRVRNVWIQIIQKHFIELERYRKSWEYAQYFFKMIAFTGKANDYHMVLDVLSNMKYSRRISGEVQAYLSELLKKRRA